MMAVNGRQLSEAVVVLNDQSIEKALRARSQLLQERLYLAMASGAAGWEAGCPSTRRWFVLRIAHRPEREVEQELTALGIEAWAPMKTIWRTVVHSKKKRKAYRPVFRGYLFVRIAPRPEAFSGILSIEGVKAILGNVSGPQPVDDRDINRIMKLVGSGAFDEKKNGRPFRVGQEVLIVDGPFDGFAGVIDGYVRSRAVRVLAHLFGRTVPIELTLAQIERLA